MYLSKHNKQVVVLSCSSIAGLLFGVLSSVINTRALDPALYGDVRYVQNIIQFVSSLLLFGYFVSGSRLLAISKDEEYSRRIRGVMCAILGGSILFTMVVMAILAIISFTSKTTNLVSLYLISIPVCGNVLMLNYINTVSQGDNHIGRISVARLLPTALYCVVAYFIYKYFTATPVLMLLLFNGIAVITLGATILSTSPSFKNLKESFHILNEENKSYGWNVYIGSLVNVSTGYISGITLGWFCDTNTEVGFYTLALTLAAPLTMLPSIIGTTYFKRFASQNSIDKKILYVSVLLTVISFVAFVILIELVVDLGFSHIGTTIIILLANCLVIVAQLAAWKCGAGMEVQLYIVIATGLLITTVFYIYMRAQMMQNTQLYKKVLHFGKMSHIENSKVWDFMKKVADNEFFIQGDESIS